MRHWTLWFLAVAAVVSLNAGEIRNLLKNPDFKQGLKDWEVLGGTGTAKPENERIVLDIKKTSDGGNYKLQQPIRDLKVGHSYRFYFTAECEKPQTRPFIISYRMRNKPKNLGLFKPVTVKQGAQRLFVELVPGLDSDDPADPPVLSFYLGEIDGRIVLSELLLVDTGEIVSKTPPFSPEWTVFGLIDPAAKAGDAIPAVLPGLDGKPVKPFTLTAVSSEKGNAINLRLEAGASSKRFRDAAMLYNTFESAADELLPVGFSADWWMEISLNGKTVYSTMENGNYHKVQSPAAHLVFLPVKKGKNLLAVKVLAGSEGWRFVWGASQPPEKAQVFTAAEGYFPIDMSELAVKKGTALDLSALADAPAGKYGRAILSPEGHIVFENNRGTQRFFGFSGDPDEKVWRNSNDREFDKLAPEYARAIRAQGYNLFRMHGFDSWIMAYSTEDRKPLPRIIDRWDRMVYEMKRQGIYLQLNLFAFWLFSSERDWFQVAEKRMANKVLFITGEPKIRARFAETGKKVLDHVNPYTKLAWKDDPAFLAVEYYNELGLGIEYAPRMEQAYPEDFRFVRDKWRKFLNDKYADPRNGKCPYSADVLKNPPLPVYWDRSQLRVDYDEFWFENLKETYRFCDKVMQECGYKGLTLQCPMPALRCAAVSWECVQIVDGHGYHCHPDGGEQPGAIVEQESSVADGASLFRYPFGERIYGRPFFFNEHNYVFRNPYQYEKPVALDAYAALNDWDSLAIHAGAVSLKNGSDGRLTSFGTANNPVLRSGEFLSALFFLRRDVAPAKHRVAVALNRKYIFSIGNSAYALAPTQSRVGLLTNVACIVTDLPRYDRVPQPQPPDLTFAPAGTGEIIWHGWFAQARETAVNDPSLEALVKTMRTRGILPEGNRTDPAKEIYQSETGEITLFAKEKKMTVVTPKSEAAALTAGTGVELGVLKIRKSGANAVIGIGSVDNLALRDSKRMVLVISTRAANTNLQNDSTGRHLRVVGTTPILYQCGEYDLLLRHAGKLRCYALRINGERQEEIPLERTEDGWRIMLDTAKLKHGPTPFFELAAE